MSVSETSPSTPVQSVEIIVNGVTHVFDDSEPVEPLFVTFGHCFNWYSTGKAYNRSPVWNTAQIIDIKCEAVPIRVHLHRVVTDSTSGQQRERITGRLKIPLESVSKSRETSIKHVKPFPPLPGTGKIAGYLSYECYRISERPRGSVEWLTSAAYRFGDYLYNGNICSKTSLRLRKLPCYSCVCCCCYSCVDCSQNRRYSGASDGQADMIVAVGGAEQRDSGGLALSPVRKSDKYSTSTNDNSDDAINNSDIRQQNGRPSIPKSGQFRRSVSVHFKTSDDEMTANQHQPDEGSDRSRILKERRASRNALTFPHILHVEPNASSVLGGQGVSIFGRNLGLDAQDITGLYLCGSNCLASLQYESEERIYCTTKSWRACSGHINLITASGGRSQGIVKFTFYEGKRSKYSKECGAVDAVDESAKTAAVQPQRPYQTLSPPLNTIGESPDASIHSDTEHLEKKLEENHQWTEATEKQYYLVLRTVEEGTQTDIKNEEEQFLCTNCAGGQKSSVASFIFPVNEKDGNDREEDGDEQLRRLEKCVVDLKIKNAELQMKLDDMTCMSKRHSAFQ